MSREAEPRSRGPAGGTRGRRGAAARPRLQLGRLVVLALILVSAALYVSPLRSFFAQQDSYAREAAALEQARAENEALTRQIELLDSESHIAERARTDSLLVPPGTQVFVVKGLPGRDEDPAGTRRAEPATGSISVLDRIEDLWRTLLH